MRVPRTVLAVLVALPLLVAGVFGWLRWDDRTLSSGELRDVVARAREQLGHAYFRDQSPGTATEAVERALESAALRSGDPLPYDTVVSTTTRPSGGDGGDLVTYAYDVGAEEIAVNEPGGSVCLVLTERKGFGGKGAGLFAATVRDRPCPSSD